MRQLSWDEFADAEGTTYSVDAEGIPPVEMTLETAAELPDSGRAGGSWGARAWSRIWRCLTAT